MTIGNRFLEEAPVIVTPNPGSTWDVSDRIGRLLGVVDTELPAAAITADGQNDPTVPGVASYGSIWNGTKWDRMSIGKLLHSPLMVTATGAVNTGVTATLPAGGAGIKHYITYLEVVKLYNIIGVAAGAGNIITSTNLPGNPAWTTEQNASPAGTCLKVVELIPTTPLVSSAGNVATTIVCPAQLQTIWRINVVYFQA